MLKSWLLLAAVETPDMPIEGTPPKSTGMALQDILLLGGVVVVVALLLFLWVYLTRKNSRRQYTDGGAKVIYKLDKNEAARQDRHRRHRKRRPNHPDNLPRNPTLAEA